MPLKRRTRVKGNGKQKSSKSEESSSEDPERCSAEEIVSRLAKKYLLKSSTDTEQSDQKENEQSAQKVVADPYDADLEVSEWDTATSADTASDMECLDTQTPVGILSPSRRANAGLARTTRGRSTFEMNKSLLRAKPMTRPSVAPARKSSISATTTTTKREPQRRRRDSGKSSSIITPQQQLLRPRAETVAGAASREEHHRDDSGMFVSPLPTAAGGRPHLPKMNASDTSTPASTIGEARSDLDDSCFGFETLMTPDPLDPISPVGQLSPPALHCLSRSSPGLSEVLHHTTSSSTSTTTSTSRGKMSTTYSGGSAKRKASSTLDMSSLVRSSPQPLKKLKKKPTKSAKEESVKLSKIQEWEAHMAEEFDDIEMNYDLTIEG